MDMGKSSEARTSGEISFPPTPPAISSSLVTTPALNSSTPQPVTPLATLLPRACTVLLPPRSDVELPRTLRADSHLTVTVNWRAEAKGDVQQGEQLGERILSSHGEARCDERWSAYETERKLGRRRSKVAMLGTGGIAAAAGRKPWWRAAAAVRLWWLSKAF
ncbi:hypothetical protein NL676_008430 [Syzygium grande]|nr:hypothetical protein NL676_008430 [Syzygium grande]